MIVRIKKTRPEARIPDYAHNDDAGVDLYSCSDLVLAPGERAIVPIGIKISIPQGYEAQVRPKSGLALNHGITMLNSPGTIDAGYRGEVCVIVINHGKEDFFIEQGKKIAQLVFNKIERARFEEVDDLDDTHRGEGGFGSSGL